MIIVVKKNNLLLISLIFLLAIAVYSLNIGGSNAAPAAKGPSTEKVVLLDAGHGGEDPGATSDYSELKEKDINLKVANMVKGLLEKDSYKVLMTREEDKLEYQPDTTNITQKRYEDLTRRKKMMDEAGADIVVSIHMNKFGLTQYSGAQTFYPPNSPESQKLAMSIQKSVKEQVDPNNTRAALTKKDPIIILKNLKTTTAIVECGFLSNIEEEKKLTTEEYQLKLATAIKGGIAKYFGGDVKVSSPSPSPSPSPTPKKKK